MNYEGNINYNSYYMSNRNNGNYGYYGNYGNFSNKNTFMKVSNKFQSFSNIKVKEKEDKKFLYHFPEDDEVFSSPKEPIVYNIPKKSPNDPFCVQPPGIQQSFSHIATVVVKIDRPKNRIRVHPPNSSRSNSW